MVLLSWRLFQRVRPTLRAELLAFSPSLVDLRQLRLDPPHALFPLFPRIRPSALDVYAVQIQQTPEQVLRQPSMLTLQNVESRDLSGSIRSFRRSVRDECRNARLERIQCGPDDIRDPFSQNLLAVRIWLFGFPSDGSGRSSGGFWGGRTDIAFFTDEDEGGAFHQAVRGDSKRWVFEDCSFVDQFQLVYRERRLVCERLEQGGQGRGGGLRDGDVEAGVSGYRCGLGRRERCEQNGARSSTSGSNRKGGSDVVAGP